jgi:glutamate dehydrogenase/leucine dehydrogenase
MWASVGDITVALPCATQNEIKLADAEALVNAGAVAVAEGANMPCDPEAVGVFQKKGILFAPGMCVCVCHAQVLLHQLSEYCCTSI